MGSNRFELSSLVQKRLREQNLNADDVLRKALDIRPEGFLTSEGILLPEGTVLLAWYKERAISAIIREGMITLEGKTFSSLSGAAAKITGRPTTNGWAFWTVKQPGQREFIEISKLRKQSPAEEQKAA